MKAVKRFDPQRGVRLVSFAMHWIKAEMHEYILRNWRLVKVATTKAQRKLFFNLRSDETGPGPLSREEGSAVASDARASSPRKSRRWKRASRARDVALEPQPGEEGESFAPIGYLTDTEAEPAPAPRAFRARHAIAATVLRRGARRRWTSRSRRGDRGEMAARRGRSRRPCRSSPISTGSRLSASARSRARR